MAIQISSDTFEHEGAIPQRHARQGQNLSPPLQWEADSPDARQLALVVDDPDAPGPEPWVHWVIYNIPPETRELPEGVRGEDKPAEPTNTAQGRNSWGTSGYEGPQPPAGDGPHRYRFHLYALDVEPTLPAGLTRQELIDKTDGRVRDEGELVGIYQTVP